MTLVSNKTVGAASGQKPKQGGEVAAQSITSIARTDGNGGKVYPSRFNSATIRITLRMSDELLKAINAIATADERSRNSTIIRLLRDAIEARKDETR